MDNYYIYFTTAAVSMTKSNLTVWFFSALSIAPTQSHSHSDWMTLRCHEIGSIFYRAAVEKVTPFLHDLVQVLHCLDHHDVKTMTDSSVCLMGHLARLRFCLLWFSMTRVLGFQEVLCLFLNWSSALLSQAVTHFLVKLLSWRSKKCLVKLLGWALQVFLVPFYRK